MACSFSAGTDIWYCASRAEIELIPSVSWGPSLPQCGRHQYMSRRGRRDWDRARQMSIPLERTARRASRSSFHFLYDAASTLLPLPSFPRARDCATDRLDSTSRVSSLTRRFVIRPACFMSTATCSGGREPHIYLGLIRFYFNAQLLGKGICSWATK